MKKKRVISLILIFIFGIFFLGCNNLPSPNENTKYTISFDSDGAGFYTSLEIEKDGSYSELPVPTKTGYTFLGWYYLDNIISSGDEIAVNANHTLTAKWLLDEIEDDEPEEFVVYFETDTDSTIASIMVTNGLTYGELLTPVKTGYTFLGWYKGTTLITSTTIVDLVEDTTLVAKWKKDSAISEEDYILPYIAFVNGEIKYEGEGISVNNNIVTISLTNTYNIYGNMMDGQIIIDGKSQDIVLALNGVSLTSSNNSPLYIVKAASVTITLASGTENYIADGSDYNLIEGVDEPNAAIFSKADLIINGSGSLEVAGNFANGIQSKDSLTIESGTISITSVNNGLKGKDFVYIKGGTITINSLNDGIEATNTDEGMGYILIDGGYLFVYSADNAIQSESDLTINGGEVTIDSKNNGLKAKNNLIINGGLIDIISIGDGLKASNDEETLGSIYINKGTIIINAQDDGIQAVILFEMNNGSLNIIAGGDGVKVGDITEKIGTIRINDGEIVIDAEDDGFQAAGEILNNGGNVTIDAAADGMKAEDIDEVLGSIYINCGDITISSYNDGLQAVVMTKISGGTLDITTTANVRYDSTISAKGIKATTSLIIDGGTINIKSSDHCLHSEGTLDIISGTLTLYSNYQKGITGHGDVTINGGVIDVTYASEAIESKSILTINDGIIHLNATDDGLNAGGGGGMMPGPGGGRPGSTPTTDTGTHKIIINGGYIYMITVGDGIDSNGSLEINEGTIIVEGPTSNNNGALDSDGTLTINGGYLVAVGSSGMAQAPVTSSSQLSMKLTFGTNVTAGTIIQITYKSGNSFVTFTVTKYIRSFVFSTSELVKGSTYNINVGGSYAGGTCVDGLYTGGTYTKGSLSSTITLTSVTTTKNISN